MTNRREFVALAAAAPLFVRQSAAQDPASAAGAGAAQKHEDGVLFGEGGTALVTGKNKPLRTPEVQGFLSKGQLTMHHVNHYGGAVRSLATIETELETADLSKANANYSAVRELRREQTHAINSIVLHELYFDGLSAQPTQPAEVVLRLINARFGSLEKWIEDFKATAIAARGWALLVLQPLNGKLYDVVVDAHDVGPMALGIPLVVLDCYEHAYYVDYQSRKSDYVAAFPKAIDWNEITRRVESLKR